MIVYSLEPAVFGYYCHTGSFLINSKENKQTKYHLPVVWMVSLSFLTTSSFLTGTLILPFFPLLSVLFSSFPFPPFLPFFSLFLHITSTLPFYSYFISIHIFFFNVFFHTPSELVSLSAKYHETINIKVMGLKDCVLKNVFLLSQQRES